MNIHIIRVACVSAALSLFPCSSHAAAGADLDEAIRKVRMGVLVVETSPGAVVRVEQLRHEFWFGAALASHAFGDRMRPEERDQYLGAFLKNFNAAVTENALKWPAMEPRQGSVDYATVNAILAWTDQHEIPLRGHNVFWGVPNMVQPWLKSLVFKQWWTTWSGQADAQGRCEVPAFFGKHRVTAGGKEVIVELQRKEPTKQLSLKQP